MSLIYQRKKSVVVPEVPQLPASRILSLAIAPGGVTDAAGFHTFQHVGSSVNTTITKNGAASIRIPRTAHALAPTSNPLAALNTRTDAWNLAAWVYIVSAGNLQNIVSETPGTNFYPLEWYYGSWYAGDAVQNKLQYVHVLPIAQWFHMNVGFDVATNTFRLHINGNQVAKNGPAATPMVSINCNQGWMLGKRSSAGVDSDMYLGSLDIDRGYFRPEGYFTPT